MNGYQYAPNPMGWVDPLGLSCKESEETFSGYAVVRQIENGYAEGHLTVEIVSGELTYSTHQVITANDKSSTSIRRAGTINGDAIKYGIVAHEVKIALPNAEAARLFQKDIINADLGK